MFDELARLHGLTAAEVQERIDKGDVNVDAGVKTRSVKQICYDNIFTLFNGVNVILAVLVLITGSFKNMLFMMVIIFNTAIGIVQEVRSKRITDKLSIVAASKAEVLRDGKLVELAIDQLVRDDIIRLGRGDQVPADADVVSGTCHVNESLLTGESDLIPKTEGDPLMSGSFVNSGIVFARICHVGTENYAARITAEAKKEKAINSEIMDTLNKIIKFASCVLFPLGAILFIRAYFFHGSTWVAALLSSVAAMVGMIPEGLILLTSTVLAVAVIRLAQSQVLVQQLYCIETLARVDTLCLDKTGTITSGAMEVFSSEGLPGKPETLLDEAKRAFRAIAAADEDPNETTRALVAHFIEGETEDTAPAEPAARSIAFSSDKKWSGVVLENGSAYVMGAAQFVLKEGFASVREQAERLAVDARLLLAARVEGFTPEGDIIGTPEPLGFVCIRDQIRSTAAQTIRFFREQGVTVNVISGDDPRTVSGIASQVGVDGAADYVDATTLQTYEDIKAAAQRYHVFGRVKPEQKKQLVCALQEEGHIVAMTGDGVNDTLALKQADCSVAMAAGSDAARNVAHLVLVDNDFASMPKVVDEGRRSINNLQRSASLFLVKTLLSMCLAALFIFLPWQYPFQPIQMTLISAFTIGLPSFVLALEPNHDRIKGRFLENVIVKSIPGAVIAVGTIVVANIVGYCVFDLSYAQVSTLAVLLTSWVGLNLVVRLSIPFTPVRAALVVVVASGIVLGSVFFGGLFAIAPFTGDMWMIMIGCALGAALFFHMLYSVIASWHDRRISQLV